MKKALKIIAYILGGVVVLVLCGAAYIQFAPLPSYDPPVIPEMTVEVTPERVAEGERIASMLCNACHMGTDGKLSGQHMADVPAFFGKFYTKNITQHPTRGIGQWTDAELYHFLRTGLRKDGSYAMIMPQFERMADEDLQSIIAYLRSDKAVVQPSEDVQPMSEPAFFGRFLMLTMMKPKARPEKPIYKPDTTQAVAWGRYIADDVYACFGCHSASFTTNNDSQPELSEGFYGGGNEMVDEEGNPIFTANLTNDPTGIAHYTEADFVKAVKYGQRPNGQPALRYPMMPHSGLTDSEAKAIFAYLRSLPAIQNEVPKGE